MLQKSLPAKGIIPSGQAYQDLPREVEFSEKQIQQTPTNKQQEMLTLHLQKILSVEIEPKLIASSPPKKSKLSKPEMKFNSEMVMASKWMQKNQPMLTQ